MATSAQLSGPNSRANSLCRRTASDSVTIDVRVCGDQAFVYGTYHMSYNTKDGLEVVEDGTYMELSIRGDDGSWLIDRATYNSDI